MMSQETTDPLLFDERSFRQKMEAGEETPLSLFKSALNKGKDYLQEVLHSEKNSRELVQKHSLLVDKLLLFAWECMIDSDKLALVAVGGYGREELCPGSDIDVLILSKKTPNEKIKSEIQQFLNLLWDMGLEPGHSVRTVRECLIEAKADVTVITNLQESRFLSGMESLYESMNRSIAPKKIWSSKKFFKAKITEQIERHATFDNSDHQLEPNVKESPGGLRDIQMIGWVAKRHFDARRLHELIAHDFLTQEEYDTLSRAREFLWHVRYVLHLETGRKEDRLLFEHQKVVARHFGYDSKDNSGVEQFMKLYYQTVVEVTRMNQMLLQHFEEAILPTIQWQRIKKINRRFQTRNNYIEVSDDTIFEQYPFALLEIFLLIQQNPKIKGVRSSTVRLIRENIHRIDESFRKDLRCRSLFMEILRQPEQVANVLKRMHSYGILGRFIPAFGKVEGLMQFDLFHVYTVDEHTLFVVSHLLSFCHLENQQKFPLCCDLVHTIPRLEVLYLAGMFHDISKGQNGDHSRLGASEAMQFCENMGMGKYDAKLVSWLVENHLLMSKTSQKKDLDDPEEINRFIEIVSDRERLNYLYLLTVADMNGTNPNIWNSWNESLIETLYRRSLRALRYGNERPLEKEERINQLKNRVKEILLENKSEGLDCEDFWKELDEDYFLRHTSDEIAWQTTKILQHQNSKLAAQPLVQIRELTAKGGTEIFVYMKNHDNIFAVLSRNLNQLALNIVDARIITTKDNHVVDTFIVLDKGGHPIKGNERKKEIRNALLKALNELDSPSVEVNRISSKKLENFIVPTNVIFTQDPDNQRTVMEVTTMDHPGVLSAIALAMQYCSVRVLGAKIATYGERVEDIFYICNQKNQIITDPKIKERLENTIVQTLYKLNEK